MAGKRMAGSELNHTNWDQDEEPEAAGSFKRAPEDIIQKRVIKTAKRRNPISSNSDSDPKSVFASFSGFTKPTTTSYSFLKDAPVVNGVSNSANTLNSVNKVPENKCLNNDKDDEYYAKLKGLNESVSSWIKKHVDSNPFVNLKPIFRDYDRYFGELEVKKTVSKTTPVKNLIETITSSVVSTPQFSFGSNVNKSESNIFGANSDKGSFLAFNKSPKTETTTAQSFTFSSGAVTTSSGTFKFESTKSTPSGFTFGTPNAKPFAFTNVAKPESSEEKTEEQDDEEPPKVEFTPVVEDGHAYTVKCKVFVKNQDTFGDRGVGMLYLKPVAESDKTQLIVRADTNLGNLLCNFILSKGIPTKRVGKKDVMLVCIPTPDSKPPPVPLLLRVKSPEQADELLTELEKYKK